LVLIIAIIYGLSTDYEVFLVSRMVEARKKGASTDAAISYGTAHTGGIITAAALIMIVVAGAFGFSDIVMMKYIAFGMIFALFIDATIVRMLLVPAVMHLLREDNWWAPKFVHRAYEAMGHGKEPVTEPVAEPAARPAVEPAVAAAPAAAEASPIFDHEEEGITFREDRAVEAQPEPAEPDPTGFGEHDFVAFEEEEEGAVRGGTTTNANSDLVPFAELMKRLKAEEPSGDSPEAGPDSPH
jgi:RND superfamily putative drug exporter